MKSHYYDRETRSIISLYQLSTPSVCWAISRVSVLDPHRGKGLARKLMDEVTADADKTRSVLYLTVQPGGGEGGLDHQQLTQFYLRCGFISINQWQGFDMVRFPLSKDEMNVQSQ